MLQLPALDALKAFQDERKRRKIQLNEIKNQFDINNFTDVIKEIEDEERQTYNNAITFGMSSVEVTDQEDTIKSRDPNSIDNSHKQNLNKFLGNTKADQKMKKLGENMRIAFGLPINKIRKAKKVNLWNLDDKVKMLRESIVDQNAKIRNLEMTVERDTTAIQNKLQNMTQKMQNEVINPLQQLKAFEKNVSHDTRTQSDVTSNISSLLKTPNTQSMLPSQDTS